MLNTGPSVFGLLLPPWVNGSTGPDSRAVEATTPAAAVVCACARWSCWGALGHSERSPTRARRRRVHAPVVFGEPAFPLGSRRKVLGAEQTQEVLGALCFFGVGVLKSVHGSSLKFKIIPRRKWPPKPVGQCQTFSDASRSTKKGLQDPSPKPVLQPVSRPPLTTPLTNLFSRRGLASKAIGSRPNVAF